MVVFCMSRDAQVYSNIMWFGHNATVDLVAYNKLGLKTDVASGMRLLINLLAFLKSFHVDLLL